MNLFDRVEAAIGREGTAGSLQGWTTLARAQKYAALIYSMHPKISMEIGVWHGRGAIAMALAHHEIGIGTVYALDAWEAKESVEGQEHEADRKHWNNQKEHDIAFNTFRSKVDSLGLSQCVHIIRKPSRDFEPPETLDFLVLDGNHGPESVVDVNKYFPKVRHGGLVYIDDMDWTGGHVRKSVERARQLGFQDLYIMDTGVFMQRV